MLTTSAREKIFKVAREKEGHVMYTDTKIRISHWKQYKQEGSVVTNVFKILKEIETVDLESCTHENIFQKIR